MKNFKQEGSVVQMTAPSGGVTSGAAYLIGTAFGVAMHDATVGVKFAFITEGVVNLPKAAPQVQAEGAALYWDNTAKNVTTTASGNTLIGYAPDGGAASADTTVNVKIYPH